LRSCALGVLAKGRREACTDEEDDAGSHKRYECCAEADAEVGAVGDSADDLRRECVAEEVNAEEIHGYCSGAYRCGDGVYDCGVERAGIEEQKKLGAEKCRNCQAARTKEEQDAEGQRECDAPETEEIESAMVGAEPALRDPAADGGAKYTVDDGGGSGKLAGFCNGHSDRVVKEFGNPVGIPPIANVSMARPKVAQRNAGLRKSPSTVARSAVARM